MDTFISGIRTKLPRLELLEQESMSRHSSFRIGGPARALALPDSEEELLALMELCRSSGIEPLIIGNGTNLLVTDRPLERLVIKTERLCTVSCLENRLTVGCGATLARAAVCAQQNGLSGLEFAHGIPGSLGGAVCMNAGAYGGEMKDVVVSTRYLDAQGCVKQLVGPEHDFSYRHSAFSHMPGIVLSAELDLTPGDPAAIRARMTELAEKRRNSQPLEKPSAGSTFKRPANGYAAAMIDQCGLKGYQVGGAAVSEKHAGFVVNLGGASFADVLAVMDHVRAQVFARFGTELEPEVRIIK